VSVSKLCVDKLCVSKLCVDKLCVCVSKLCVCGQVVCEYVSKLCGRRRREEQARECPTKNKNPTQRCGENV